MKRFVRPSLRLEALETRECPALTLQYLSSGLVIRGVPTADLTVTATGVGSNFEVKDGIVSLGTFNLNRNLTIQLASRPGNVRIDLAGKFIAGNVLIDLGNGYTGNPLTLTSVDIFDSTVAGALGTGEVRGSVTMLKGNGFERFGVGAKYTGAPFADNLPITVRGNVTVVAKANANKLDLFQLGEGSNVGGSVSLTQVDDVSLGNQDVTMATVTRVARDVSITTAGAAPGLAVNLYGTFGRHVTVNGSASTINFNSFNFAQPDLGVDSTIAGNLTVNFGQAVLGNLWTIAGAGPGLGTSTILGAVRLASNNNVGILSDSVLVTGSIFGSLFVNLGNGDNTLDLDDNSELYGNLTYTGGNGTNTLNLGGFGGTGFLGGSLNLRMGNGTNVVNLTTTLPGKFIYRGGNGDDTVTIAPVLDQDYVFILDMLFGSGINTFTLDATNVTGVNTMLINGLIKGTGGANTFNLVDPNGTLFLSPLLVQINWP